MALLKSISIGKRFSSIRRIDNSKFGDVRTRSLQTHDRLKGTFLERWGKYWKNLYIDYRDVAIDALKDFKERPIRCSFYIATLGSCYYLSQHNPDASSYRDQLLQDESKLMQIGPQLRNPISEKYITWIEQCYNEGIVRRLNLGIISFIWLDNYDSDSAVYKATCSYLKPRYVTFYQRIIDVGFMDKWWILEQKMQDYDVNETEFLTSNKLEIQ